MLQGVNTNMDSARYILRVGDSRQGWVKAYEHLLRLASIPMANEIELFIDLSDVRKQGAL